MKRTLLSTLSLLAALSLGLTGAPAFAAEKTTANEKKAEKAEIKEASGKPFPYVGKVTKVDPSAKSFSLNGKGGDRNFVIDDATKITKDGKPATLAEVTVGEEVRGQVSRSGEIQTAKSVLIGAKAKPGAATAPAAPATEAPKGAGAPATTPSGKAGAKKP